MLCIAVDLLTGRYAAASHTNQAEFEWPPHPARLFAALVATWAEEENNLQSDLEKQVLEELEKSLPPSIAASTIASQIGLSRSTYFVPVNDTTIFGPKLLAKRYEKLEIHNDSLNRLLKSEGEMQPQDIDNIKDKISKERNFENETVASSELPPLSSIKKATGLLPDFRLKQPRFFPSIVPANPTVHYQWADLNLNKSQIDVLDSLLGRVVRLGHSTSLVSCRLVKSFPEPTWKQDDEGKEVIRVPSSGELKTLCKEYELHRGQKPRKPVGKLVKYANLQFKEKADKDIPFSNFSNDWIVLKLLKNSKSLSGVHSAIVAKSIRKSILKYAPNARLEGLSGHAADGSPSLNTHLAILPIPFVGHEHASGQLLGVAIVPPTVKATGEASRQSLLDNLYEGLANWQNDSEEFTLLLGKAGRFSLKYNPDPTLENLKSSTWSRPSDSWASVTPIALDKYPGKLFRGSLETQEAAWDRAEESVAQSCEHIGLERPIEVSLARHPFVIGSARSDKFPPFPEDKPSQRRILLHAKIKFKKEVGGPVVLGAGRFSGLGLMRPLFPRMLED